MKKPAFQFYPGDWMKDPAVRSLSLEARGLWIDMLCLMHESDRRGYLQHISGKPVTHDQLARMTGCSAVQVSQLLQELKDSGVFSSEWLAANAAHKANLNLLYRLKHGAQIEAGALTYDRELRMVRTRKAAGA